MRGVDTNVLVRYIVQDEPDQAREATKALETPHERFVVCQLVLCELVWVLGSAYGYERAQITRVLRQIMKTVQLIVELPEQVYRAIDGYERGDGDLADFLIYERSLAMGAEEVITFDRKLMRSNGFSAPH